MPVWGLGSLPVPNLTFSLIAEGLTCLRSSGALLDYYILARQRLKYSSAKGLNSKPGVVYLAFYLVRLGMSVVKHNC